MQAAQQRAAAQVEAVAAQVLACRALQQAAFRPAAEAGGGRTATGPPCKSGRFEPEQAQAWPGVVFPGRPEPLPTAVPVGDSQDEEREARAAHRHGRSQAEDAQVRAAGDEAQ